MEYISREELFRHIAKQEASGRGNYHDENILEDCRGSLLVEMERITSEMGEAGETDNEEQVFRTFTVSNWEGKLANDIAQLREEMYELHNQEEAYHSLIANAIEQVRFMVKGQLGSLSTKELKKELRRRKNLGLSE